MTADSIHLRVASNEKILKKHWIKSDKLTDNDRAFRL